MTLSSRTPPITLVAACSLNWGIGIGNDLLWRIPEDLRRFRSITLGQTIVMGRKTYDSIGKPLPGRSTRVVSSSSKEIPGIELFPSLRLALLDEHLPEIFVVGGASIYLQALPLASRILLTLVHETPEADAFFPPLNFSEWRETSRERIHSGKLALDFLDLSRKQDPQQKT